MRTARTTAPGNLRRAHPLLVPDQRHTRIEYPAQCRLGALGVLRGHHVRQTAADGQTDAAEHVGCDVGPHDGQVRVMDADPDLVLSE